MDGESVAARAGMRVILGQETRMDGDDVAVRVGRAEMDMQIKSKV